MALKGKFHYLLLRKRISSGQHYPCRASWQILTNCDLPGLILRNYHRPFALAFDEMIEDCAMGPLKITDYQLLIDGACMSMEESKWPSLRFLLIVIMKDCLRE